MDRLCDLADEGVRNARRAIMKRFFEQCKTAVLVKGHGEKLEAIVVSSNPKVGERHVDALSKGGLRRHLGEHGDQRVDRSPPPQFDSS